MRILALLSCAFAFPALSLTPASAQVIFSSDLNDDGASWSVVENGDTSSQFQFDYSSQGIPSAPNGDGTVGVRLASNLTGDPPGAGSAIAVAPGINASGQYTVQFDFWLNYHINGSTEEGGGSIGFDGSGPLAGTSLLVNTDGDAGQDYKLYQAGTLLGLDSGMYAIPSLDDKAAENEAIRAKFPGSVAPDAQGTGYTNLDGTLAFGWHTMLIDVDSNAGSANFSIDGFDFGTVTGGSYTGDIALVHTDPFGSVAGNADLAFAVFDNVVVTQVPEPSSSLLIVLGYVAVLRFRRRR